MLAAQTVALLLAAERWWRVSNCVCVSTLEDAALWTGIVTAQSVVILGIAVLGGGWRANWPDPPPVVQSPTTHQPRTEPPLFPAWLTHIGSALGGSARLPWGGSMIIPGDLRSCISFFESRQQSWRDCC